MEAVAEVVVLLDREEPKSRVETPFQLELIGSTSHLCAAATGLLEQPLHRVTCRRQCPVVRRGTDRDAFRCVVKEIQVSGITGTRLGAIDRRDAREVTFWIPVRREQPNHFFLKGG